MAFEARACRCLRWRWHLSSPNSAPPGIKDRFRKESGDWQNNGGPYADLVSTTNGGAYVYRSVLTALLSCRAPMPTIRSRDVNGTDWLTQDRAPGESSPTGCTGAGTVSSTSSSGTPLPLPSETHCCCRGRSIQRQRAFGFRVQAVDGTPLSSSARRGPVGSSAKCIFTAKSVRTLSDPKCLTDGECPARED
jgi:hypothetical protein